MDKRYTLSVTETQLHAINTALEEFFRLRLAQAYDLAEDIAFADFNWKQHSEDELIDRIYVRDNLQKVVETGVSAARERLGMRFSYDIGETARICEDVWQVIRHQFWIDNPDRSEWTVDSRPLLPVSDEPAARCFCEIRAGQV